MFLNIFFWRVKQYCDNIYFPKTSIRIREKVQIDLADVIKSIPFDEYNQPKTLDEYNRIFQNAADQMMNVCSSVSALFGHVLALVMIFSYVCTIDVLAAFISFIPFLALLITGKIMAKLNFQMVTSTTISERKKAYAKRVFYLPQYVKEIRLTGISNEVKRIYREGSDGNIKQFKKIGTKMAFVGIVEAFFNDAFIVILSLSYVVIKMQSNSTLFIGDFIGLSQGITFFSWNLGDLGDDLRSFMESIPHIKEFRYFIKRAEKIKQLSIDIHKDFVLSLEHVSYRYKSSDFLALDDISLTIKKGEKIAIVGENGSGKTTLVSVIMNLLQPSVGRVTWNNITLDDITDESKKNFFVSLFQDFNLYPFTIKENVVMGNPNITDDKIEEALDEVQLNEIVQDISRYYTNEFDERGINLSGGQKQRLASLRILTSDAPFIILDEPTSALDVLAEEKLYKLIAEKFKKRTVLFISHKLSTTSFADKIIFLKNGRINEFGTHKELMKLGGEYSELYQMQASRYQKESANPLSDSSLE